MPPFAKKMNGRGGSKKDHVLCVCPHIVKIVCWLHIVKKNTIPYILYAYHLENKPIVTYFQFPQGIKMIFPRRVRNCMFAAIFNIIKFIISYLIIFLIK